MNAKDVPAPIIRSDPKGSSINPEPRVSNQQLLSLQNHTPFISGPALLQTGAQFSSSLIQTEPPMSYNSKMCETPALSIANMRETIFIYGPFVRVSMQSRLQTYIAFLLASFVDVYPKPGTTSVEGPVTGVPKDMRHW
ncbi:hypothetical protein M407DRAFT_27632 [Tulasnella calospora MUT 4182]|uniref:Uncharacterized protein n=1 Tax=Tulasnella calospora MUT 4182 TaxID=1051891 RepID=A0A0C3LNH3_9AGAM|nr:hypothetical protein M407DRAFT_27632 [Tulasnella calospora MUT 4182]